MFATCCRKSLSRLRPSPAGGGGSEPVIIMSEIDIKYFALLMLIYALKLQIEKWCIYNYAHGHTGQWTLLDF